MAPTAGNTTCVDAVPLTNATPLATVVIRPLAVSTKLTVPVGPAAGLTDAVNVTAWPKFEGSGDEVRLVVVPGSIQVT